MLSARQIVSWERDLPDEGLEQQMEKERIPAPDEAYDQKELCAAIRTALANIPAEEALVIILRNGLLEKGEHTLKEIQKLGLGNNTDTIRRMEAHGLRLLRHPQRSKYLRPFL